MKPLLVYCYDAYCGWCYGFSSVIKKIETEYKHIFDMEVLSGGMFTGKQILPIEKISSFIEQSYKNVEITTGIEFGQDFLWHINNPDKSDWVFNSEKPAIALCIFKEFEIERQVEFATDLGYALNFEGRDLDDDETYKHLLEKYKIDSKVFYEKLKSKEYFEKALYEFASCKQLGVDSFPQVFIQQGDNKYFKVAQGFTTYDLLKNRIDEIIN